MELKDVILSTLAEMEDGDLETLEEPSPVQTPRKEQEQEKDTKQSEQSELMYLNSIRERLLVLFEGFQSPNNSNIEAKVDMTLNFLEYTLATIDSRVQKLKKGQ